MLRVGKAGRDSGIAVGDRAPAGVRRAGPGRHVVRHDPWRELGAADLTDTVRRICTLCGWTQARIGQGQSLAITSAVDREGKSSIARAAAIATARDYAGDVLLLECDLLNPSLSEDFGLDSGPGLTEILSSSTADLRAGLRSTGLPNLWLLPAGGRHDNPSRLLRSAAMSSLVAELRDRFAFMVMDLPSVLRSSDASVLARMTDGVVLVVRAGSTDQRLVEQALHLLSGTTLHGVVLNRWRSALPDVVRRVVEL